MQNKIDRLILNANREFSDNRNVISALVDYSRTLDLFEFLEKSYKIQIHETTVRIAICYDILGNFNKTLDYLSSALKLVPNVASLILYKAVLLQTVGQHTEAQNCLLKYKQMKVKNELELFETFRIVFLFSMQLEKDVLLREINDFTEKYKKNTVILYLRAMIYQDLSNQKTNSDKKNIYLQKYEDDINEAMSIDKTDTEFLLKDKITNENLTKLFFMIVSEMDYYQPKALVNYSTFHTGFKLFYTLFRIVKIFKVKIVKKKLKAYYKLKIKNIKNQNFNNTENSNSISNMNESSISIGNNTQCMNPKYKNNQVITLTENTNKNRSSTNNTSEQLECTTGSHRFNSLSRKIKLKLKTGNFKSLNSERKELKNIVSIKNKVDKANIDDYIADIKKEYEIKINQLYKSVWLNHNFPSKERKINFTIDYDTNYFILNNYYSPYNFKQNPFVTYDCGSENKSTFKTLSKKNNELKKGYNSNLNNEPIMNISESSIKVDNNVNSSRYDTLKLSFELKNINKKSNDLQQIKLNTITENMTPMSKNVSCNINNGQNTNNFYSNPNNKVKLINLNKKKDFLSKNLNPKDFMYKPAPKLEVIRYKYTSKEGKKSTLESITNNPLEGDQSIKKEIKPKVNSSTRKSIDIKYLLKSRKSEAATRNPSNEIKK